MSVAIKDDYKNSIESIIIPETYGSRTVTEIAIRGFIDCIYLREVSMPDTIESIGYYAFLNCRSLSSINLSKGLTRFSPLHSVDVIP